MGSPLREGLPSASDSTAFSARPAPAPAPAPVPRRLPSPQGSPLRPPVPEESRPAPPCLPSPQGSPLRPPALEESRPAPYLPPPQKGSPPRAEEGRPAGRSPLPRLPSPPEDAAARSPAREEDRPARATHVPRLSSLLLQDSPAPSPPHEAGRGADGGRIENATSSPAATSIVNRASRDEPPPATKFEPGAGGPDAERGSRAVSWILQRRRRGEAVGRAAIAVRLAAVVLCLVSFSVMAADKTKGWAGDSFDRYREYRFCITVNILTFVYSGFQAYAQAHRLVYEKDIIRPPLRYYFDFAMDQVLAYLLMAASAAAATRTDDWVSNWGSDPFTVMANGSTAVSFLAFVVVAVSALISAHSLFGRRS